MRAGGLLDREVRQPAHLVAPLGVPHPSVGTSLLEHHPQRKADKHESEDTCSYVFESAARVERATYGTRSPRNAYIHDHHGDREDPPQQGDLQ